MRELEGRRWNMEASELRSSNLEVRSGSNSKFQIPNSVALLFIISSINCAFNAIKTMIYFSVCVSGRFVNLFWTVFTTSFAPFFGSVFNQLNPAFIHEIHITNKNDNILYKLIITN